MSRVFLIHPKARLLPSVEKAISLLEKEKADLILIADTYSRTKLEKLINFLKIKYLKRLVPLIILWDKKQKPTLTGLKYGKLAVL